MDNKYDNIIKLSHHISNKHAQMSIEARAAQFAPFAALTGYNDKIKETARLTNKKIELDEDSKSILDRKIQILLNKISTKPTVSITYFMPDSKKDGGKYVTTTGIIKKLDRYNHVIILEDKIEILLNDILLIDIC